MNEVPYNACNYHKCGHANVAAARFCAQCGRPLSTVATSAWTVSPWRALRFGMSPDAVRTTLGEPGTIRSSDWLGDRWYYSPKWKWTAYCEFHDDRLNHWVEPSSDEDCQVMLALR